MLKVAGLMVFCAILCSAQSKMPVNADEQRNAIEKITPMAEIIVEGKVINEDCFMTKSNLYTIVSVRISKIFKGSISDTLVSVVYEGGACNGYHVMLSHGITLIKGTGGIFFLKKDTFNLKKGGVIYGYSLVYGEKSFIRYYTDHVNPPASIFNIPYYDIEKDVYQRIETTTGQKRKVLRLNSYELQKK